MANDTRNSAKLISDFLFTVGITGFRISKSVGTYTHRYHRLYSCILCWTACALIAFCFSNIRTVQMDLFSASTKVIGITQLVRDAVFLCGYLGLILIGQIGVRAQQNLVEKLRAFDVRLCFALKADATGRIRLRLFGADAAAQRSFWRECIVWTMYYNVLVYPIEVYMWDFWSFAAIVTFFGFVMSTLAFGWVQSWVKFCATRLQKRTQRVGDLMRLHLIDGDLEDATDDGVRPDTNVVLAVHAMSLVGDVCALLRGFEAAFATALMFVYKMLLFSSLFNVYFTLQIIQRRDIGDIMLVDFALYQVPLIGAVGWLVLGYMQHFGDEVSDW